MGRIGRNNATSFLGLMLFGLVMIYIKLSQLPLKVITVDIRHSGMLAKIVKAEQGHPAGG
jgi:hypothetical protein